MLTKVRNITGFMGIWFHRYKSHAQKGPMWLNAVHYQFKFFNNMNTGSPFLLVYWAHMLYQQHGLKTAHKGCLIYKQISNLSLKIFFRLTWNARSWFFFLKIWFILSVDNFLKGRCKRIQAGNKTQNLIWKMYVTSIHITKNLDSSHPQTSVE